MLGTSEISEEYPMRHPRRLILTALALLVALTTSAGAALAANRTATNVFYGVATTGQAGQPFAIAIKPLDVNPTVCGGGAIGIGLAYVAGGIARG